MTSEQENRLNYFYTIIKNDDCEAVESARSDVKKEDVALLILHYKTLDDWNLKRATIDLIQDQYEEGIEHIMLDYLRAPYHDLDYLDMIELTKAIALSFMGEDYDQFMTYYNDRTLLHADIQKVLVEHNLSLDQEETTNLYGVVETNTANTREEAAKTVVYEVDKSVTQNLLNGLSLGEYTQVQEAINRGVDVNYIIDDGTYSGCSALIFALLKGHYTIGQLLIEHGADINFRRKNKHRPKERNGQTALWWAATYNNAAFVRYLINLGAEVDAEDAHHSTPLTTAASSGALDAVNVLLEFGANVHAQIYDGRKAMNLAATNGYAKIVGALIEAGTDPDYRGSSGYTSLMIAAEAGKRPLIKVLLEKGANVNAKHLGNGNYSAYKGMTPLAFSVSNGFVKASEMLIKAGADVNYVVPRRINWKGDEYEPKPILKLATGQRAESVRKLLLKYGAAE